ncbi:nicotinate-nucleotide pyrophosphorylase [carboxylating] [Peptoniphilus asaccharolyticus DSM 20463]|uniref:Probable nicotinate-nucleotide pyrophosphorylase [carboxylating] n=1 Tax=Peptoniphilus asaccharolyticus DSM 20463 TaxID=573058 RepID=A0A1W1UM33_PEPAS|nr:carboxylating nicotinate-nucleotide diphosphorylase [Peptoniphilus asaccharolyticus]MBL7574884.1 carboxylating nicotinate-nucleotide diphosphorylase [Peptoniphilus asaccharolyticus]SMB82083.1 nicotinate-nucleotide pyrophosphorylase [carboxylating] [Peptoniphilus asaccharolyticus DSM 20463]
MQKLENFQIDDYLEMALKEDVTHEDVTTNAIYTEPKNASVELLAKEEGIIAGIDVFKRVFQLIDSDVKFEIYKLDGDSVKKGDLVAKIFADVRTLLTGERTALNYMQRMSGVATYANKLVKALNDPHTQIVDTRKTTPNMRLFEKYAATVGGAKNHRYNLSDAILLKDNHIAAAGSVFEAVNMARDYASFVTKIEVEVENLEMVREAVDAGADIIMLDNMDVNTIKKAIEIINGTAYIELSGNVSLENVEQYRALGADFISSGSITHSSKILDLSMKNLKIED